MIILPGLCVSIGEDFVELLVVAEDGLRLVPEQKAARIRPVAETVLIARPTIHLGNDINLIGAADFLHFGQIAVERGFEVIVGVVILHICPVGKVALCQRRRQNRKQRQQHQGGDQE